ncbi:hypothetical protein PENSPDRAFT_684156 [Peniophora sp. CONT]|nr:hypothetical protein PENSPDRAFT_684156 [Peniophora sp. CONT]
MSLKDLEYGYIYQTYNGGDAFAYWTHLLGHDTYTPTVQSPMLSAHGAPTAIKIVNVADREILDLVVDRKRGTVIHAALYTVQECLFGPGIGLQPRKLECADRKLMRPVFFFDELGRAGLPISQAVLPGMVRYTQSASRSRAYSLPTRCELEYNWPYNDELIYRKDINIAGPDGKTVTEATFLNAVARHLDAFVKTCTYRSDNMTRWAIGKSRKGHMITRDNILIVGLMHLGGFTWRPILQLEGVHGLEDPYPRTRPLSLPPREP